MHNRGLRWATNRVVLGVSLFLVGVGFWEFKWKPQYRPYYEQGVAEYQHGHYPAALREMSRAYNIAPNSTDVIMMMGWVNLKLKRYYEANYYFQRVLKIDAGAEEAEMGEAFVTLESGQGKSSSAMMEKIFALRQHDPNVRILEAGALTREGKNWQAAAIYRELSYDKSYGRAARAALANMFGLSGFDDPPPAGFQPVSRPEQMEMPYRAAEGALERRGASGWEKVYITGVDLGPGAPGFYPSAPPLDGTTYSRWLNDIAELYANTVRVYTLLPPAFYRAFSHEVRQGKQLALLQQVWIEQPPNGDLYDPKYVEATKSEIRHVIDALHGHGDVPVALGRASGIYDQDVSSQVAGILLGRPLEPSVVEKTNFIHPEKVRYGGGYVGVERASATEAWFAEMLDYLVAYESTTYNSQHPVAIVNWPPLDPLYHPTESSAFEEYKLRASRGEIATPPATAKDEGNDSVSIDEAKFKAGPAYQAGLFASYSVYPYYPDFLLLDARYLRENDGQGPDPMYAYLRELHAHIPYPLVVSEFGVPNSIGISHFQPDGWNEGGHTETEQATIVARMSHAIQQAGCAGGLVFELQDEWYKQNWLTKDFEQSADRALWQNQLDPDNSFGLIGYRPRRWRLFAGDAADWRKERTIYSSVRTLAGTKEPVRLESVQAASDEAFLYLRLGVACAECAKKAKKNGGWPLGKSAFAVAIQTLPGAAGVKQMPFGYSVPAGANFLLVLSTPSDSQLLVADNYNPYETVSAAGNQAEVILRRQLTARLQDKGGFEEMWVQTNRRRFARNGTMYPAQRYSRSRLRYGNGNPSARDYDSLAEWFLDPSGTYIVARLAWGKLLVTSPPDHKVFGGIEAVQKLSILPSPGVQLTAFQLEIDHEGQIPNADLGSASVVAVAPALVDHTTQPAALFTWEGWNSVSPEPFLKKAYYEVQKAFAAESPTIPARNTPLRTASRHRGRRLRTAISSALPPGK